MVNNDNDLLIVKNTMVILTKYSQPVINKAFLWRGILHNFLGKLLSPNHLTAHTHTAHTVSDTCEH